MIFSPRRSEAAKEGKSCAADTAIPARAGNRDVTAHSPRRPFTTSHFAASILRGAILLLVLLGAGNATAAVDAMGVADMGPPPCAPVAAIRKVDAATAATQVRGLIAFPLPWNAPLAAWDASSFTRLADSLPDLSSPTLGPWFTDMLKVLAVIFFFLAGVERARSLFGRTPPIHIELETLRNQIIPKKKIEQELDAMRVSLLRIEHQQHLHSETLAANTAIRDANGERLIEVVSKQDAMSDSLNRLIGRLEGKKATA